MGGASADAPLEGAPARAALPVLRLLAAPRWSRITASRLTHLRWGAPGAAERARAVRAAAETGDAGRAPSAVEGGVGA